MWFYTRVTSTRTIRVFFCSNQVCFSLKTDLQNQYSILQYLSFQDRDEQRRLEMKHRKEEDDLYRKFARAREEEERRIKEEIRVSYMV